MQVETAARLTELKEVGQTFSNTRRRTDRPDGRQTVGDLDLSQD